MTEQELMHKKNLIFMDELPIALNSLKRHFFDALIKGGEELSIFYMKINKLIFNRYGLENDDPENAFMPIDLKVEDAKEENYILLNFEIDKKNIKESCDSRYFTIYANFKTTEIRVFSLEYEPSSFIEENDECYMLCEHSKDKTHKNYGIVDDDSYKTYVKKIKEII